MAIRSTPHTIGRIDPAIVGGRGDTELVPGVRAVASHGHTAGHTLYLVESQGQKLALWGEEGGMRRPLGPSDHYRKTTRLNRRARDTDFG